MKEIKIGDCFREFGRYYKVKSIDQISNAYGGNTIYGTTCIAIDICSINYNSSESIYDNGYQTPISANEFDNRMKEFFESLMKNLEDNNIKI